MKIDQFQMFFLKIIPILKESQIVFQGIPHSRLYSLIQLFLLYFVKFFYIPQKSLAVIN